LHRAIYAQNPEFESPFVNKYIKDQEAVVKQHSLATALQKKFKRQDPTKRVEDPLTADVEYLSLET